MPESVDVVADAIPEELKNRDQWLIWDKAAPKKQPYKPANGERGAAASWTDPDEWVSFEKALETAENIPTAGLGYVFAKSNDDHLRGLYGGLDLDGCHSEDGKKDWLPSLQMFFDEDAYMEFSPSGDGIHIPLVGFEPPEWWKNVNLEDAEHEGVEAYGSKFFTFTGDTIKGCGETVGEINPEKVNDWLAEAYEKIKGVDPREVHEETKQTTDTETRETKRSREEVADLETTTDFDDVLDAIDHLKPSDLPLRSSKTGQENAEIESWDPGYRQSESGLSLKYSTDSGLFWDMEDFDGGTVPVFGPLELFAAEEGIIRHPTDKLEGEDWKQAVEKARERGAPIPEYVGGELSDVTDTVEDPDDVEFTDKRVWEIWSQERASGELDGESIIPTAALRHIADFQNLYDFEEVPEHFDELPDLAHNRALSWLQRTWGPDELDVSPEDEQDVTLRSSRRLTPETVFTWEDVRVRYEDSNQAGRYAAVKLLRERYDFLVPDDTEELHIYNHDLGVFELGAEYEVGRELDRNLGSHYSQHEKNEVIGRLRESVVERGELEAAQENDHMICVENGVLNVDERELYDHSPDYQFTAYMPVEYDPEAECPRIHEFLEDITRREEDKKVLLEVLGNCLLPNYEYEYVTFLFGEGANGKSTWLNVVRSLLGDENTSSVTLQKLAENRFASARLVGKWANIAEELPDKKLHNTSTLKNLSGGGDVPAEKKGEDGFDFKNRAKLIYAANRPPVIADTTDAMRRRLVPIYLPYKFTDKDDDHKDRQRGLVDELTTDQELSGLLNATLDALERLKENGDVSLPETTRERLELYERHSDHIKKFRIDCLTNEGGKRLTKDEVYNAYTNFCAADDREPVAKTTFWKQLRKTTLNVTIRKVGDPGDRYRIVDNAAFTDVGVEFAPDFDTAVEEESTAHPLSSLAPGEDGVVVEGQVQEVQTDTPPQIAEKAVFQDETDSIEAIVWADSNKPTLEVGQAYRFKNVEVGEFQGEKNLELGRGSGVEKIATGAGNAPSDDPGKNEQIATAADGGSQLKERVEECLRTEYGPGADVSVPGVSGAIDEDPTKVEQQLEEIASTKKILSRTEDGYRLLD